MCARTHEWDPTDSSKIDLVKRCVCLRVWDPTDIPKTDLLRLGILGCWLCLQAKTRSRWALIMLSFPSPGPVQPQSVHRQRHQALLTVHGGVRGPLLPQLPGADLQGAPHPLQHPEDEQATAVWDSGDAHVEGHEGRWRGKPGCQRHWDFGAEVRGRAPGVHYLWLPVQQLPQQAEGEHVYQGRVSLEGRESEWRWSESKEQNTVKTSFSQHTHPCSHAHTHMHTHTHAHTYTLAQMPTHTRTHAHTYTCMHTCTHTHTHTNACMHTHINTQSIG